MLYLFSILYVKISHSITLTPLSIQALLVSLDLGAAFDTITHSILLCRLSASFGVSGTALLWLSLYIIAQSQTVRLGNSASSTLNCSSGVPQWSVLGPILLSINVSSVYHIAQSINIAYLSSAVCYRQPSLYCPLRLATTFWHAYYLLTQLSTESRTRKMECENKLKLIGLIKNLPVLIGSRRTKHMGKEAPAIWH